MNVLKVENISKHFGKKLILDQISFVVNENDIVGLVGANGAGKTTSLRAIAGLISTEGGSIQIKDYDLVKQKELALSKLSAIIETPCLYTRFSGRMNMEYIQKINRIPEDQINTYIHIMGMESYIDEKVRKYSLGMKQRLAIGISMMKNASLLLLDEPTNGLDPTAILELRILLKRLASESNIAILVSSHNLSEMEKLCNRIVYIQEGRIVNVEENKIRENSRSYKVRFSDITKAITVLKVNSIEILEIFENEIIVSITNGNLSTFIKLLAANNLDYESLEPYDSVIEKQYNKIYVGEKI